CSGLYADVLVHGAGSYGGALRYHGMSVYRNCLDKHAAIGANIIAQCIAIWRAYNLAEALRISSLFRRHRMQIEKLHLGLLVHIYAHFDPLQTLINGAKRAEEPLSSAWTILLFYNLL